jgi:Ca2+-dependent lipid-binding protein
MYLNKALFNDNGNSGYVLKPEFLRKPDKYFEPNNLNTMNNKKIIQIKIISAQNLPQKKELIKDITDSYVVIQTYGVDADKNDQKTKTIKDNGFNPIWNEDFQFVINCPELAFIKFKVMDEDAGKDDLIGHFSIRFENIRTGRLHLY